MDMPDASSSSITFILSPRPVTPSGHLLVTPIKSSKIEDRIVGLSLALKFRAASRRELFLLSGISDSGEMVRRVPMTAPDPPSVRIAATWGPVAIPPAPRIGMGKDLDALRGLTAAMNEGRSGIKGGAFPRPRPPPS